MGQEGRGVHGRQGKGARRERGREGREREKGSEGIGEGEGGEGEWGLPSHYFWLKSCTDIHIIHIQIIYIYSVVVK